ncbi:hypothetical protein QO002_002180 [Pararhizobium capsulatum DSM 1112]|uniref:Uncharacterized protein n=1 Tax=Pararhizobium capsulatum DSM 1112 TaxID=1121113 RepID=A0ABU0BPZ9_9HYPH|nr:hypothetical protein [Pararhizobium capsulatum DSM 1112]
MDADVEALTFHLQLISDDLEALYQAEPSRQVAEAIVALREEWLEYEACLERLGDLPAGTMGGLKRQPRWSLHL